MKLLSPLLSLLTLPLLAEASPVAYPINPRSSIMSPNKVNRLTKRFDNSSVIAPKVMLVSMFSPEREVWIDPLNLTNNVTVPGLSPLFPEVACTDAADICMVTTGESEINAATTMMALLFSSQFNFTQTYFLIAGIAGINPERGTLGTAAFANFAVQVALQYELDAREMPSNWTTGYWAFGSDAPGELPENIYGTEVYQLNTNLAAKAAYFAQNVTLNDSDTAVAYRANFDYSPAKDAPAVTICDVATSDVYYAGEKLSSAFDDFFSLMTDGQGKYCTTAQEDNASLEAMVRAHVAGFMDYSRVMILRTASDFDRRSNTSNLTAYEAFTAEQGGFEPAIQNLYLAGYPIVKEIAYDWASWVDGVPIQDDVNSTYYGNIFGSLRNGTTIV